MNKEVHYEGWLIKSPPSKRIWRSRWRRRWFTLKQGEIPEQFCLEYYTDRNCRKLKGIIDLDQCEQVDCGLRLENRKQKFQFMFDIKTPKRTYYLAADSAADMRDWVNCICQVCHLHDTKHSLDDHGGTRFSNNKNKPLEPVGDNAHPIIKNCTKEVNNEKHLVAIPTTTPIQFNNVYQNSDSTYVNAEHCSSELLNDLSLLPSYSKNTSDAGKNASIESISTVLASHVDENTYLNTSILCNVKVNVSDRLQGNGNGAMRKVPENLILQNSPLLEAFTLSVQPSPSLSTSSGPYIPISECFSGPPKHIENPTTPLNNLDPKFYDTPRSHNNIGLNLTNDKSYSPKITNCSGEQITPAKSCTTVNNRSDSDSESVFTDDDDWTYPMPLRENVDRNTRPSDSSVENESFVLTYSQRFSKLPDDAIDKRNEFKCNVDSEGKSQSYEKVKLLKNKRNLSIDMKNNERSIREIPQLSDTENTSPAIGPQDASSIVEESYDIPRSHQLPYHNLDQLFKEKNSDSKAKSPTSLDPIDISKSDSLAVLRKHFYTNAAPKKFERNVFRYDFVEQAELPPVNRKLKPKTSNSNKLHEDISGSQHIATKTVNNAVSEDSSTLRPPSVDRNLKPNAYKLVNSALMEKTYRCSIDVSPSIDMLAETDVYVLESQTLPRPNCSPAAKSKDLYSTGTIDISVLHQRSASANTSHNHALVKLPINTGDVPRLQYFDLDLANPPPVNRLSISTSNMAKQESNKLDPLTQSCVKSGVVYNSVDFVKTEAFKRIREERKKESGVNSK